MERKSFEGRGEKREGVDRCPSGTGDPDRATAGSSGASSGGIPEQVPGYLQPVLELLATEENPLTLFTDDLQWCDTASFDFLNHVFANHQEHPYLLFLGAYRHNEVDQSHPLWELIEKAKEENKPLVEIRLKPLEPRHSHEMVSYILDSPLPETKALADFINSFSEGNPLFISESLSYLYYEDLLFMGEDRQLCWDIEKIRRSSMPTTIAALFSSKIQKLPRELIENLEYCACMGNSFSPAELSAIGETTLAKTFDILKPALSQGLLVEHKGSFSLSMTRSRKQS